MPTEQDTLTPTDEKAFAAILEMRDDIRAIREAIEQLAAAAGQVTEMFGGGGIPFLGGLPSG